MARRAKQPNIAPDEEAFLFEIAANPDSDAPRLVFADWLEERGDPRSEFIRIQCELATMADNDDRRWDLKSREEAILRKHRVELYNKVVDVAYKRRGWTKNGVPTIKRLKELGIDLPELVEIVKPDQ